MSADSNDDGGKVLPFPRQEDAETYEDQESIADDGPVLRGPVDPSDEPRGFRPRRTQRRPIVPAWLRGRKNRQATAKWVLNQAVYVVAFHAVRMPKYVGKVAMYAPVGALRVLGRLVRWAAAEEGNYTLRQSAASRDDAATWLKLDMQRQQESRWRWFLVVIVTVIGLPALAFTSDGVPALVWWLAAAVGIILLALAGRPADRPITDRVTEGKAYRKLTAELVRRALLSVQLGAINSAVAKDANAISFPQ